MKICRSTTSVNDAYRTDDDRFHGINELRGQLQDLIASHAQQIATLTATLMPREVAEARLEDMTRKIDSVAKKVDAL